MGCSIKVSKLQSNLPVLNAMKLYFLYIYFRVFKQIMGNKVCGEEQVTLDPNLKKGNELYLQGNYNQALTEYTTAVNNDPKNPHAYTNRAACYDKLKQYPECKADLDKVIEIDPANADAYNHRGLVNRELNDNAEAQSDFDKSISLNPHSG